MDEEKLEKLICKALKTQWSELPNGRFNVDIEVSDNDILVWCLSSDVEEGGAE